MSFPLIYLVLCFGLPMLGFAIFLQAPQRLLNRLVLASTICASVLAAARYGLCTSETYEQAVLWRRLFLFRPAGAALLLHIVLTFFGKGNPVLLIALTAIYGPALGFATAQAFTGTLLGEPARGPLGWSYTGVPLSTGGVLHLTWIIGSVGGIIAFCWSHLPRTAKSRSTLLAAALTTTSIGGFATEMLHRQNPLSVPDLKAESLIAGIACAAVFSWKLKLTVQPADIVEEIVDALPDSLIIVSDQGLITSVNGSLINLSGYQEKELLGASLDLLLAPTFVSNLVQLCTDAKPGNRLTGVPEAEQILKTKDGECIPFALSGNVLYSTRNARGALVLVGRDLRNAKKASEHLKRLHRLEGIELLSRGIAHDFNNLLSTISANLEVALMGQSLPDTAGKNIHNALCATRLGASLTTQLSLMGRNPAPQISTIALQDMLVELLDLAISGTNVTTTLDTPPELWLVSADPHQLGQVFLNLFINARQAMPAGGVIGVRCENAPGIQPHVLVHVCDTGCGIEPLELPRIFEPLYTTKKTGTGLGLSIARDIISAHNGTIAVHSNPGAGTTFTVSIPAVTFAA